LQAESLKHQRNDPLAKKFTRLKVWDKYIVAGLQLADTATLVLRRSVAPPSDIKGFQPFLQNSLTRKPQIFP